MRASTSVPASSLNCFAAPEAIVIAKAAQAAKEAAAAGKDAGAAAIVKAVMHNYMLSLHQPAAGGLVQVQGRQ